MNWKWSFAVAAFLLAGCSSEKTEPEILTLATTTSTRDSGLLDVLVPMFEKQTSIQVKVIAVGSGQALELGRRGDADVLLTHAPAAEDQFMSDGDGELRLDVMVNDFVLVGPQDDPAEIQKLDSITAIFQHMAQKQAPFISRGDDSGTHRKEQTIWKKAKIDPAGDWYIQAGAGMAQVLRMASEKQAYTLSDRGTFLAQRYQLNLTILGEGDPLLHNPYSVIVVDAEKHPSVNSKGAKRFAQFLRSPEIQRIIGEFGTERFQQPLFFPTANAEE